MEKRIICFDTGEIKGVQTEKEFSVLPLLQFMESAWDIKYVYRQIVTFQEMVYYFKQIGDSRFQKDCNYGVVYFNFPGFPESVLLRGSGNIPLDSIAEEAAATNALLNKHVHWGFCKTLCCDDNTIHRFKCNTGARSVSGYTETVNSVSAYINELAYFCQIFQKGTVTTIKTRMNDFPSQLLQSGFCIY